MAVPQQAALDLPFPLEEYQRRWARVQDDMASAGVETLVVWQRSGGSYDRAGDVHWLTNYASLASGQEPPMPPLAVGRAFAALIIRRGEEPELHMAEPVEATDLGQVAVERVFGHANLIDGVAERLTQLAVEGDVTYVGDDLLPTMFQRTLAEFTPAIRWLPSDTFLWGAQWLKSRLELDVYREAGAVASRALTALMEGLIAGEPETVAGARAAAEIVRAGGGFQRVCAHHGPRSEKVMWSNGLTGLSTQAPAPGDMVRGWVYGPILHGYWLDPGRSAVCGRQPGAAAKALIEATLGVVNGLIEVSRPGVTAREIGRRGDELVQRSGYSDKDGAIWQIYGHGLSAFFSPPQIPADLPAEAPFPPALRIDEPTVAGQVLTIEVFLTDPGVGTATFEEVFIVGEQANEVVTTTPQVFW